VIGNGSKWLYWQDLNPKFFSAKQAIERY